MAVLDRFQKKFRSSHPRIPYLILTNSGEETRFPLEQDIVSIGRSNSNGICLNDSNISKRHCLLVKTPEGVKMMDLESTNGTCVNDRKIVDSVLRDGDHLRIGPFEFRYFDGGFVPPPPPVMPGEEAVGRPFADQLVRELRRSPCWLMSLAVHAALMLFLWNSNFMTLPRTDKAFRVTARNAPAEEDPLEDSENEDVEEEVPEPDITFDPEEEPYEESTSTGDAEGTDTGAGGGFIGLEGGRRRPLEGLGPMTLFGESAPKGGLGKQISGMRGQGLDVAIVFDSTGSMQGIIDQVKSQISLMNTYVSALVPGNYRLAMVTYRDRNDTYLTKLEAFTQNYYQILLFIEQVNAAGGDDIPEAVLDGLRDACRKLKWRKNAKKVILLFGDAPPHEQDIQACRRIAARFRKKGGVIHTIFTEVGAREDSLDTEDKKTVNAYRTIAHRAGGTFNFLDQESQIIKSIQILIFGKEYEDDVNRVTSRMDFGWKGRNIQKKVQQRDIGFFLKLVRMKNLHPLIVKGLIVLKDPSIVPEMRKLAMDPDVAQINRSAAQYILLKKGISLR